MKKKLTFIVFIVSVLLLVSILLITYNLKSQVKDTFSPLPANSVHFSNYLENDLQNSIQNWNKGVVPYPALVEKFRSGRSFFAQGEMWGKAVRSACMFYRYTQDPELKKIIEATVKDLLSTQRENGSISCSDMDKQPDGPGGDLWERKYVLLALLQYYNNVDEDTLVLQSIIDQVDCIISQIGYPPKTRIIDLGWSPNHIESSTLLEPVMKLYNLTRKREYLDFASYIVEEGGAKGYNIIEDALANKAPKDIGGVYPKAYEMMSLFEGLIEYYRVTDEDKWKQASLNLYHNIIEKELTIIGNGGGDQPYHPAVMGEAWDNTALEQTLQRRDEYVQHQPHHPSVDSALEVIRKGISVQENRVDELVSQLEHLDRREALELKAPIDGVVSQILHRQTEVVLAGEPILTIAEGEITDIIAYAAGSLMDKVQEGMPVELIKSSEPTKIQIESSEVTYVGPVVEQMPSQLWLNPNVPQWGRPFLIKAPAVMKLIAGERIGIRRQ